MTRQRFLEQPITAAAHTLSCGAVSKRLGLPVPTGPHSPPDSEIARKHALAFARAVRQILYKLVKGRIDRCNHVCKWRLDKWDVEGVCSFVACAFRACNPRKRVNTSRFATLFFLRSVNYSIYLRVVLCLAKIMSEKNEDIITRAPSHSSGSIGEGKSDVENEGEVFKKGEGYEDFRTVGWVQTTVILLKSK
jgi:hypothetical protein